MLSDAIRYILLLSLSLPCRRILLSLFQIIFLQLLMSVQNCRFVGNTNKRILSFHYMYIAYFRLHLISTILERKMNRRMNTCKICSFRVVVFVQKQEYVGIKGCLITRYLCWLLKKGAVLVTNQHLPAI